MATLAVLFADGFEEIEAITLVDVLRRAEIEVLMTGVKGHSVIGAHAIRMEMDTILAELPADLDGVILPGGMPGAKNLAENPAVLTLIRELSAQNKWIAAICAAPIALSAAGILQNRRITCYPSFEQQMPEAQYTGAVVETDGQIITARGPGAAFAFALTLVEKLGGADTAERLRHALLLS